MRFAFISDIHGNATALDAVLNDINLKSVDKVFVLGDICFRGPEPKRSLKLIRSLNTDVIKGNADEWVVRGIRNGEVPKSAFEMMNKERDWTFSQLDQESLEYLGNLPTELNLEVSRYKIQAFHATPDSLFHVVASSESDHDIEEKLMVSEADIFLYAHIHKPYIRFINGKCVINIGSVGLPFDGLAKSSYALLDIDEGSYQASIIRVSYDVGEIIKQFKESNYPNSEQMIKVVKNARI